VSFEPDYFNSKLKDNHKTSLKSYKTEIIILANRGFASSGFEQPDPVYTACQNALQAKTFSAVLFR